jgi:hypothetical protein
MCGAHIWGAAGCQPFFGLRPLCCADEVSLEPGNLRKQPLDIETRRGWPAVTPCEWPRTRPTHMPRYNRSAPRGTFAGTYCYQVGDKIMRAEALLTCAKHSLLYKADPACLVDDEEPEDSEQDEILLLYEVGKISEVSTTTSMKMRGQVAENASRRGKRSEWCRRSDSNRGPIVYKTIALPTELQRQRGVKADDRLVFYKNAGSKIGSRKISEL